MAQSTILNHRFYITMTTMRCNNYQCRNSTSFTMTMEMAPSTIPIDFALQQKYHFVIILGTQYMVDWKESLEAAHVLHVILQHPPSPNTVQSRNGKNIR